jgi:hypothetical protein
MEKIFIKINEFMTIYPQITVKFVAAILGSILIFVSFMYRINLWWIYAILFIFAIFLPIMLIIKNWLEFINSIKKI